MIVSKQYEWLNGEWKSNNETVIKPQLCLVFGSRFEIEKEGILAVEELKKKYPGTKVVTTSTAGNIVGDELKDNTMIATCLSFEKTEINVLSFTIGKGRAEKIGSLIANSYAQERLSYLLLLSTSEVDAESLIHGINSVFAGKINVSGGVAGDDTRFEKTLVGVDEDIKENNIVAVGFYSDNLLVSNGSRGGWSPFGPKARVTKAEGNILYEIDNAPVLPIYKEYLGKKAKDLPSSGLLFPFSIIDEETGERIVRAIQDINEEDESLVFYGEIKKGSSIQLMRAQTEKLFEGAVDSASKSLLTKDLIPPQVAILISCVARRLALDQLTEEELEEVRSVYGEKTTMCGFYSYAELSPVKGNSRCHLHNQTLTITSFSEF